MSPATYHLFSTLQAKPNVGVWILFQPRRQQQPQQAVGQPVRLGVDLVEVFYFLSSVYSKTLTQPVVDGITRNRQRRSHHAERRPLPVHL